MRMNSEITQEEYQAKKDSLLKDKHKHEELLKDANQRVETWLDRAETMFNFAETAQKRFTKGSLEMKRDILSCLGSNLSLKDRKLDISLDNGLALLLQVAPEIQNLHNRLEPTQVADSNTDWEAFYSQTKNWGPSRTSRGETSLNITNFQLHHLRLNNLHQSLLQNHLIPNGRLNL